MAACVLKYAASKLCQSLPVCPHNMLLIQMYDICYDHPQRR